MAAAINLTSLINSPYQQQGEARAEEDGRTINRYNIPGIPQGEQLTQACTAITNLLRDNPSLVFVSKPQNPNMLSEIVANNRYLVINGSAVCLSNKDKAPDNIDIECVDIFFSESLIDDPIKCPEGHVFEKKHIASWHGAKNRCPHAYPGTHRVRSFAVDTYFKQKIRSSIAVHEEQKKRAEEDEARFDQLAAERRVFDGRMRAVEAQIRPDRTVEVWGGGLKICFKGALTGLKVSETGGKFLATSLGKKIPIFSIVLGVVLAGWRIYQGYQTGNQNEYYKAVGELASGIAGCFPGIGTGVSLAIDASMCSHDFYEVYGNKTTLTVDIRLAKETLGLDPDMEPISKDEIDRAFRNMSFHLHPDRMGNLGNYTQQEFQKLQQFLGGCKDHLYTHYGYANQEAAE